MSHSADFIERARRIRLLLLDVDGVLTDGRITLGESEELKSYSAKDGLGITLARVAGIKVGIITGRRSTSVARRAAELKLDYLVQGRPDKWQAFEDLSRDTGIAAEETAYMGDDWIDLAMLERVGLAACPRDARPELAGVCQFVSQADGGNGAVRELVEAMLKARGDFEPILESYRQGRGEAASAEQ